MKNKKTTTKELAIFGGDVLFPNKIHVGTPNIGDKNSFQKRVDTIFGGRILSNDGPMVKEFEAKISEVTNVAHSIAVTNATTGLELVCRALKLKGEVIVPSYTFIATVNSLVWMGLTPVFCEVDSSHTIDIDHANSLITDQTTAILAVNLWGRAANIEKLQELAKKRNLKLIFDSAHAFCCSYKGQKIGGFGDAEVFSFHATKFVNSFEGGAICTNNDILANELRIMRNSGLSGKDNAAIVGTNAKMSEISAAMGITSIESMTDFIAINRAHYETYQTQLGDEEGVKILAYNKNENNNYQYIVMELDAKNLILERDQIHDLLCAENILARKYFWPGCHRMPAYRLDYKDIKLPYTEALSDKVIVLPTGPTLSQKDINAICDLLKFILANQYEIADRLSHLKVA